MSDKILIRGTHSEYIAYVEGDCVERVLGIGVPKCPSHAWSRTNMLAFPVRRGRAVQIWDANRERPIRVASVDAPISVRAVAWLDDLLVVGGADRSNAGSKVATLRRPYEGMEWSLLEMPRPLLEGRKAVDGFAVSPGHLVAIDNIIIPKWAVVYDRADALRLDHYFLLTSPGTYERVIDVESGENVFAVCSSTVGRDGYSRWLTLYEFGTWRGVARTELAEGTLDFAMQDDNLLILRVDGGTLLVETHAVTRPQTRQVSSRFDVPALGGPSTSRELDCDVRHIRRSATGRLAAVGMTEVGEPEVHWLG